MIDLKFERVSKRYRVQQELERGAGRVALSDRLRSLTRKYVDFWALKDVSFQVARGEALGIIGPNGAGKSTVLKLLSKITTPTSGEVTINGRLSALIEVGSGFHPELTGRENIYLSGSILGMRRREITDKLNSIIDFAGVRQFIDTPVKRYSSGMYVRLGFSIAAHLQHDILLLDEVLAVGDAAFQARCYDRIRKMKSDGTTIVFISHHLTAVESLCDRAMLLSGGKIVGDGLTGEVISAYEQAAYGTKIGNLSEGRRDAARRPIQITALRFFDYQQRELERAYTGEPLVVNVEFAANESLEDLDFEIFYYSPNGKLHCQFSTSMGHRPVTVNPGEGIVQFSCQELGLQPGTYYADATIKRRTDGRELDWQYRSALLQVKPGKRVSGSFYAPHKWRMTQPKDRIPAGPVLVNPHSAWEETASADERSG